MDLISALIGIWLAVLAIADYFPKLAGTIYAGGVGASVPIGLFLANRAQSKRQATLDLHKEYYSVEFAEFRSQASRFMRKHERVNWQYNDPYALGSGDDDLAGYSAAVRFFHRFAILYELNEMNRGLAQRLFSREVGYWKGKMFDPMKGRDGMFVLDSITDLANRFQIGSGGKRFYEGLAASKRAKAPELIKDATKTVTSVNERWGQI